MDLAQQKYRAILAGLAAASLFGIATPFSKLLLAGLRENLLSGLLYLGAAVALCPSMVSARRIGKPSFPRDRLNRLRLAGAIIFGGLIGPVLLLIGLRHAMATSVSIWLNLETVATAVLACLLFGEQLGRWAWLGNASVLLSGIILGFGEGWAGLTGIACVGGAAIAWGVDNNLTAAIDGITPQASAFWKGIFAGSANLAIGLAFFPSGLTINWAYALALGGISYGASIALYIYSAQALGAARSQMLFASAPFFGIALSILLLGEKPGLIQAIAALILALGLGLLLIEQHKHEHVHSAMNHIHSHRHDDSHHTHTHEGLAASASHTHEHSHEPTIHTHPHLPDIHHRHH